MVGVRNTHGLGVTVLSICFFLLTAFCFEMPKEKYVVGSAYAPNWIFYGFLVGGLLLGAMLITYAHKRFSLKVAWPVLILVLLLFFGNVIAVFGSDISHIEFAPVDITFTVFEKLRFAMSFLLTCVSLYYFFGLLPRILPMRSMVDVFLALVVFSVLGMCIYSYINESSIYAHYLSGGEFDGSCTKAFTSMKNFWAMVLFIGTITALVGQARTHRLWWFIPAFIFAFTIPFSFGKTEMVGVGISLLLCLILAIFREWKRHRSVAIFSLVSLAIIGTLIVIAFFPINVPFAFTLRISIQNILSDMASGGRLTGRDGVYDYAMKLIGRDGFSLVFGYGNYTFDYLMGTWTGGGLFFHAHNAWLETLGRGGIVRLAAYIGFLGYYSFILVRDIIKHRHWDNIVIFVAFIGYLLFSHAEFPIMFDSDIWGLLLYLCIFLPLMNNHFSIESGTPKESFHASSVGLSLFDLALLGLIAASGFAFINVAPWVSCIALLLDLALAITVWKKGERQAIKLLLLFVVFDTLVIAFLQPMPTDNTYSIICSLCLSVPPSLVLLYASYASEEKASWIMDRGDIVFSWLETHMSK